MMTFVDGNAAAGEMRSIFAMDVTAATGRCANCGFTGPLGAAQLYTHAPGMVMRCPSCEAVLMRMVTAPSRTWVDMQGLAYVELDTGTDST
jgi:hypothetical protein